MDNRIRVAVVGVTGYTGLELVRILSRHPGFEISAVTSRSSAGMALQDVFPHFQGTAPGLLPVTIPEPELIARDAQLVFLAVPHAKAMDMAASLMGLGVKVVDLSADFRLNDPLVYSEWYQTGHRHQDLLKKAVYGIPELYSPQITDADLVANPGCYPTSVILALYPALKEGLISPEDLIVDSKSGTSGAGRTARTSTLFCEVADSFKAYNLGRHRHTPEMEQELSRACGSQVSLFFSPHLVPMSRGILSTCYARLEKKTSLDEIRSLYRSFYQKHPWVRVMPDGVLPETRWVRGTMFCDLGIVVDQRTGRLVTVSAIDNLCRGASGQAVANANLMSGFDQAWGLDSQALMP
ncbi:N-acetyl-gamma-glutamyl-phosphate reductase [Desulfonatronovibrio hydrogenovorans]|uniref:N-acetyl-gamma-glutamyl-phosphate reductase n=1 Tax=Desulfonatronovibrio hydrogenovorans TaxID=53245 RepID=UPI00048CD805|nr:N-acetyl-gamma-glutamyl-phosphate reductase [Desulfonatronovibrio hydrogenovorans]